ncbi:hypothetical protein Acsp05_41720 [Actinokineospora sp. NBRC 105648]|nr:hypothetical protein Acsp05_41720 [Actinokineospora sp. NBRC 105648]
MSTCGWSRNTESTASRGRVTRNEAARSLTSASDVTRPTVGPFLELFNLSRHNPGRCHGHAIAVTRATSVCPAGQWVPERYG